MSFADVFAPSHPPVAALAIGNFDGVHLGHQSVLGLARRAAGDGRMAVLVPDPHPLAVLGEAPPLLTDMGERAKLLLRTGADLLLRLPFDAQVAAMGPREFVEQVILRALAPQHVVVGFNFTFGRGASAGAKDLREILKEHGVALLEASAVLLDGEPVSSTRVRSALRLGEVEEAAKLLGRPYGVRGVVRPGHGRGRTIGFPTANVHVPAGICLPRDGVYAVRCTVPGGEAPGVANLGARPTFEESERLLEVHLFSVDADLYGMPVEVSFVGRLRGQVRFASAEELRRQIAEDSRQAKEMLGVAGA